MRKILCIAALILAALPAVAQVDIMKVGKTSVEVDLDRNGVVEKATITKTGKYSCKLIVTGKDGKMIYKEMLPNTDSVKIVTRDVTLDGNPELIIAGLYHPEAIGGGLFAEIYKLAKGKLIKVVERDSDLMQFGLCIDNDMGVIVIKAKKFDYYEHKNVTVMTAVMNWEDGEGRSDPHKMDIRLFYIYDDGSLSHEGVFDTKRKCNDYTDISKEFPWFKIEKDDLILAYDSDY